MKHKCQNCGEEYDCGDENCRGPIEFGFCSSKCFEASDSSKSTKEGE